MLVIILAGGRATRMGKEKAIMKLKSGAGQRLIDMVIGAVKGASKVDDFIVAVTKFTPQTTLYCRRMNYRLIETPGYGYHVDLRYLLHRYHEFISVACDIPFLQSEHIDALIDFYSVHHNSVTGAVPFNIVPAGIAAPPPFSYRGQKLVACGLNAVTNSRHSLPLVFHDPLLAINVNTHSDLQVASQYLHKYCK